MVPDHEAAGSIFGVRSGVIDDRATRATARFQDAAAREDSMNPKETSGTLFPSCPRSWNGRVTARDRVVNDRRASESQGTDNVAAGMSSSRERDLPGAFQDDQRAVPRFRS